MIKSWCDVIDVIDGLYKTANARPKWSWTGCLKDETTYMHVYATPHMMKPYFKLA